MYHFIYNPIAGKGRAQRARAAIEGKLRALNVPYAMHETHGHGEAQQIARELTRRGEQEIIAVGGCSHGADYAISLIPGHSNDLFATKVIDIICKPRIS